MKIKISHLGVIEKAEIHLKPLTVFIGPNGTGKTWTAYALSAIFGPGGYHRYLNAYIEEKTQQTYPLLDAAIQQLIDEGNARINIVELVSEYAEAYINDVARLAPTWMPIFMASERIEFEKLHLQVSLAETKTEFLEKIKNASVNIKLSSGLRSKESTLNVLKERAETNIYFYTFSTKEGDNILDKLPRRVVKQLAFEGIFGTVHRGFYSNVYFFPTERTTFITIPVAPVKSIEDQKRVESEDVFRKVVIDPVNNFLLMVVNAYAKKNSEREEQAKESPDIQKIINMAHILENEILQGNVIFDTSLGHKELIFQISDNIKLEMPVVSSMVKELAPLVLYLRYLAEPDEWLIIDEPEMNLHPAAQVEIIEFLAMLVQAGLNVLITTHSPYIVDHLSNLMRAAKRDDKDSIKERFYLERTEAFIPQEKVSVYLFEDGTAKNILSEDGRIDWGTFADVSDDISHILP